MDITINKEYATIDQLKNRTTPNKNEIRVYCVQYPNVFNFQIRTHKSTDRYGKGKERDMIATVMLTIAEVENILEQMKAYSNAEKLEYAAAHQ